MINEENFDEVMKRTRVPEAMHGGLKRYLFDRVEPGSFLRAVLENDLVMAMANSDENMRYQLHPLAGFMYNELPARDYGNTPWGSAKAVSDWLALGQERPVW